MFLEGWLDCGAYLQSVEIIQCQGLMIYVRKRVQCRNVRQNRSEAQIFVRTIDML